MKGNENLPRSLNMPFPLRPDFTARVLIPRDLTTEEAKRLAAFIAAFASLPVAIPHSPAGSGEDTP